MEIFDVGSDGAGVIDAAGGTDRARVTDGAGVTDVAGVTDRARVTDGAGLIVAVLEPGV